MQMVCNTHDIQKKVITYNFFLKLKPKDLTYIEN